MPSAAPNTVEVVKKVEDLVFSTYRFRQPHDLQLRIAERAALQLRKSDPLAGCQALAQVAAMAGQVDRARELVESSLRLSGDPAVQISAAAVLGNLGYFSEAGAHFRFAVGTHLLSSPHTSEVGLATGSIRTLAAMHRRAGRQPTSTSPELLAAVNNAADVLEASDIEDEAISLALDVAGEIMRRERLIYAGLPMLFVAQDEGFSQVDFAFAIDVGSPEVAELNFELAGSCYDRGIRFPDQFSFRFTSRPGRDERIAA